MCRGTAAVPVPGTVGWVRRGALKRTVGSSAHRIRTELYALDRIYVSVHIIRCVPVEVIVTDEFVEWYRGLDDPGSEDVDVAIGVLESRGVSLGAPRSSEIKGSLFALRELRLQSNTRPFRIIYAFDPRRQAVLLIGGDKTGIGNKRFYAQMIPLAERIWQEYLDENP